MEKVYFVDTLTYKVVAWGFKLKRDIYLYSTQKPTQKPTKMIKIAGLKFFKPSEEEIGELVERFPYMYYCNGWLYTNRPIGEPEAKFITERA